MPYGSLIEFVRKSREQRIADPDISARLANAGWYQSDIHDALILEAKLTDIGMPITKETIQEPAITQSTMPAHRMRNTFLIAIIAFIITFVIAYVF